MATSYITINAGMRLGSQLRGLIDGLRRDYSTLVQLRAEMITMIDGNAGDPAANYALLETQFGLATGQGYNVWYAVDQLYGKLSTDASVTGLNSLLVQTLNQMG